MKAIQVKFLPATRTKDNRYKAFINNKYQIIEARDYRLEGEEQARRLAVKLIAKLEWPRIILSGWGMLPNGDYVATLSQQPTKELEKIS